LGEDWEKYSGLEVKGKIILMKTFFPKSSELSIQEISNEQSSTPPIGNGQLVPDNFYNCLSFIGLSYWILLISKIIKNPFG
jgi:hypothetical protein